MKLNFKLTAFLPALGLGFGSASVFALPSIGTCLAQCNGKYNTCIAKAKSNYQRSLCAVHKEDCKADCY